MNCMERRYGSSRNPLRTHLGRPVQSRTDPGRRLVIPDPIHTIHDLKPLRRAPAGHEGTRDRHVDEIDGQGIVHDPSCARWGRGPPIGTTICVEPNDDLIEPTAQTLSGTAILTRT